MSGSTASRVAGVVSLTIDGDAFDVKGPLSYRVTDSVVEGVKGQSGPVGYSEIPDFGFISAKLFDNSSVSMAVVAAKRNSTLVAVLANGKTVYGSGMFRSGEVPEVDTMDATYDIKFEGKSVTDTTV